VARAYDRTQVSFWAASHTKFLSAANVCQRVAMLYRLWLL